jgi:cytochrome c oxidase subunit 3
MDSTLKNKTSKQLLWVGMAGITMLFAGLTSAYIVRKAEGNWLQFEMPNWFWFSTVSIVICSALLHISKIVVKNGKSPVVFLIGALFLGLFFSFSQIMEWQKLVSDGVYFTGKGSNPAGSFLYVITLVHLLHLIGGLVSLTITSIKATRGKYTSEDYLGIELNTIYWHFLDLLWLYLFFFMMYI